MKDELVKIDGRALWQARKAKDWTQETLAGRAKVSRRTIQQIENGEVEKVRPETVESLAEALGVKNNELMKQSSIEAPLIAKKTMTFLDYIKETMKIDYDILPSLPMKHPDPTQELTRYFDSIEAEFTIYTEAKSSYPDLTPIRSFSEYFREKRIIKSKEESIKRLSKCEHFYCISTHILTIINLISRKKHTLYVITPRSRHHEALAIMTQGYLPEYAFILAVLFDEPTPEFKEYTANFFGFSYNGTGLETTVNMITGAEILPPIWPMKKGEPPHRPPEQ